MVSCGRNEEQFVHLLFKRFGFISISVLDHHSFKRIIYIFIMDFHSLGLKVWVSNE